MQFVRDFFRGRPVWMNAVMLFCAYMTFVYMPFDMFLKPVAEDQEVWFGIVLTGWAAKATEPLHWLIYGFGFYGFLKMKPWMWPWASLYVLQIAIGMVVWSAMDPRGGGILTGALVSIPFIGLAIALGVYRGRFDGNPLGGTPLGGTPLGAEIVDGAAVESETVDGDSDERKE